MDAREKRDLRDVLMAVLGFQSVQQTSPVPHEARVVHGHPAVVHVCDWTLQHSPAVQSPSLQQALAGRQAPPQQCAPEPHCASFVHPQLAALHVCVVASQQAPAVQSLVVQHPAHAPLQHT
jgi:hypothetical protein